LLVFKGQAASQGAGGASTIAVLIHDVVVIMVIMAVLVMAVVIVALVCLAGIGRVVEQLEPRVRHCQERPIVVQSASGSSNPK
jgi:uncharacterized membrane protein